MSATTATPAADPTGDTQVLTFTLGEEAYCVPIEYVAEIVEGGEVTTLPNSEEHVEGVMDLRGRTTTIIDPSELLELDRQDVVPDGGQSDHRVVVLDSESLGIDSQVGWKVSDVSEVKTVAEDSVETGTVGESDLLRGIISGDDGFLLWVDPFELVT